jgi:acyl carrier protein
VTEGTARVREVIAEFLQIVNKPAKGELGDDLGLYAEGLDLDSLEAAELSAHLEDEFDSDPFSAALTAGKDMPETVGDIVAFYGVTEHA